jgi:hypothetical protein
MQMTRSNQIQVSETLLIVCSATQACCRFADVRSAFLFCGCCWLPADKARAAAREDEELDEDGVKDPWLLQAAHDAARAAASGTDVADATSRLFNSKRSGTPLKSSTAVFEQEAQAPIFDQATARRVLLKHMRPRESVQQAMRRLATPLAGAARAGGASNSGGGVLKTKMKNVRSKPKEGADAPAASATAAVTPADLEAEKARKAAFDELMEAAQGFLSSAYVGTFSNRSICRLIAQGANGLLLCLALCVFVQ